MGIFDYEVSQVVTGTKGKIIMVYGGNSLGKTTVGSKLPKPLIFKFETSGLNAISGAKYISLPDWKSFKLANKSLEKELKQNREKVFEEFETIVFDNLTLAGKLCERYVVNGAGVNELHEGNRGQLYKRFENEFWEEINRFLNCGLTIFFIAHEVTLEDTEKNEKKKYPKGDYTRVVKPVMDACDVIGYLRTNGTDEDSKVINSSVYFAETEDFFARSRYPHMVTYLEEFSAESLQNAITEAIEKEAKSSGKSITYEEDAKKKKEEQDKLPAFSEIVDQIKTIAIQLNAEGRMEEYQRIVEDILGVGALVNACTEKQTQQLQLILGTLKELDIE